MIGGALFGPIGWYVASPAFTQRKEDWADVGNIGSLPPGQPEEFDYRSEFKDGWRKLSTHRSVWVIKRDDSHVTVFSPICPHLGCAFRWDGGAKQFKCPCHGSVYDITGKVLGGPAPRPLDALPAKLENGELFVVYKAFRSGVKHQEEL